MDKNRTLYKILKLSYIDNMTQLEIANKMKLSRLKVLRYLDYAKKNGFVEVRLNIPIKDSYELERTIEKKFMIRECSIIPTFSNINDTYKYGGIELYEILKRFLKKDDYIGVSWSKTLMNTLDYFEADKKFPVNVVPIVGGIEIEGTNSSNFIANKFAEKIGGINYAINIPTVFDNKETRRLMDNERQTRKIKELAERVGIAITGIGDINLESTIINSGYFSAAEIDYLKNLKICGIINLNFINKNGEEVKTKLDDRIIKILSLEKLKKTEIVIGIAFGKNKVNAIKATLAGRIINCLITDEEVAKALIQE